MALPCNQAWKWLYSVENVAPSGQRAGGFLQASMTPQPHTELAPGCWNTVRQRPVFRPSLSSSCKGHHRKGGGHPLSPSGILGRLVPHRTGSSALGGTIAGDLFLSLAHTAEPLSELKEGVVFPDFLKKSFSVLVGTGQGCFRVCKFLLQSR